MHGFMGCVEENADRAEPMFWWMAAWIGTEPAKKPFSFGKPPFAYMASMEASSAAQPMAADESGQVLVFKGFIAADQLPGLLKADPATDADIAAALLQMYLERGARALAGLNGRYVVCVWDPHRNSLELMNDILGLTPVFLWQGNGSFAFSSNVWAIACHPQFRRQVDLRGLADLLMLSCQQGNRTLFEGVSVLPPGSVTTFQAGKLTSRSVRTLQFSSSRWDWGIERIADEMHAALAQSVARRVPDHVEVLLPLSGGFDSRVLLGLLCERPVKVHAVTQYQHGLFGDDARYARRLARSAGVDHKVVPLSDNVLADYRAKCVAINGGMYDVHTGRFLSLQDLTQGGTMPTVSAHLGGELTSRFQVSDTRFATPEEHFRLAFSAVNMYRFAPAEVQRLMGGRASADLAQESLDECRRFFLSHEGSHFQRFFNWDLLLCRRRYICYQLLYYEQFNEVIAPFYDRDFVDLMCSVPFAAVENQRAYIAMMTRHFPRLARVPNTNTDLPVLLSMKAVLADFIRSQHRRFLRNPIQRVFGLRRWVGHPMEQIGFALAGASRPVLDHIVQSKGALAAYVNADEVQEAVNRQLRGDNSTCMGLLGLSAFATALEMLDNPSEAIAVWREDREPGDPWQVCDPAMHQEEDRR